MISLARKTLTYEWRRFISVAFSIGFSGLLLVIQAALVLGIFGSAAIYIKASSADIWVGYPGTQSVNYGRYINPDVGMLLRMDPDVDAVESYTWVDGDWWSPDSEGGNVSVYLSGIATQPESLMFSYLLSPELRMRLREPGAVIIDPADIDTLGTKEGGHAWINRKRVHVVGLLRGLRGLGGVNVLASQDTAMQIGGLNANQSNTYIVASLRKDGDLEKILSRLKTPDRRLGNYEVWSATDFAYKSQRYWLMDTGAGIAVLFMAVIVCIVGAIITSQSLKTVMLGYNREFATLNALGATRKELARVVIELSFLVGGVGLFISAVMGAFILSLASYYQVPVAITPAVLLGCVSLVAVMILLASISVVRSQYSVDPSLLLR